MGFFFSFNKFGNVYTNNWDYFLSLVNLEMYPNTGHLNILCAFSIAFFIIFMYVQGNQPQSFIMYWMVSLMFLVANKFLSSWGIFF